MSPLISCRITSPREVTRLLQDWANGEESALEALTQLVYSELRRLAAGHLRREAPGHTLQPTALVHEAFLRLLDRDAPHCPNRSHFYGLAAHLMRLILVDHARNRQAAKRGGGLDRVTFDEARVVFSPQKSPDFVRLDAALERLAAFDPRKARVVELRFFGGLSVEESAEVLGVSPVTVRRDWQYAKTWLLRELGSREDA